MADTILEYAEKLHKDILRHQAEAKSEIAKGRLDNYNLHFDGYYFTKEALEMYHSTVLKQRKYYTQANKVKVWLDALADAEQKEKDDILRRVTND